MSRAIWGRFFFCPCDNFVLSLLGNTSSPTSNVLILIVLLITGIFDKNIKLAKKAEAENFSSFPPQLLTSKQKLNSKNISNYGDYGAACALLFAVGELVFPSRLVSVVPFTNPILTVIPPPCDA